jgi:hypothetical protein
MLQQNQNASKCLQMCRTVQQRHLGGAGKNTKVRASHKSVCTVVSSIVKLKAEKESRIIRKHR